jgi:hypothetical protein
MTNPPTWGPARGDTGAVTAELAVALTSLTLLFGALTGLAAGLVVSIEVHSAAAAGARLAARHESPAVINDRVVALAGAGARCEVSVEATVTTVVVHRPLTLALPGHPTVTVSAQASAVTEPVDAPLVERRAR